MATDERAETKMDADNLYREEIITDRRVGTLRMMTPLKSDGSPDGARATLFIGEAQIMTNAGPLPINFEIEANNLAEAVANFGAAAKEGVERTVRELQELRRQQSSSIVVPGAGGMGGMGGLPGIGGGGKIQMP
ncbi:MAG: hypothetical protein FJY56_06405 [Betaproteobacteria bacterium]|nr:hypothetical protein [Betaproteobacteria bacterium]